MAHKYMSLLVLLILLVFTGLSSAQQDELESVPVHKSERAFSFSLSTNGLGLGGVYRHALPHYIHVGLNVEFFIVRDDNEFEIYDPFLNRFFKVNDLNRLFFLPVNVELKKRLFADDIEDNFRPHLMLQVGGMFGMNFPKETIVGSGTNGRKVRPDNQYQLTYDVVIGFGVDITTKRSSFATVRPQYRFTWFQNEIAGKRNHSTFEIKFEIGGQF